MLCRGTLYLGLCVLASSFVFSERIRFDDHQVYKVLPSDKNQLDVLKEMRGYSDSMKFLTYPKVLNQQITVVVPPHEVENFIERLVKNEISHELVEKNFQNLLDAEIVSHGSREKRSLADDEGQTYNWTTYHSLEDTYAWINEMANLYPSIVQPVNAGVSYERRQILGVRISSDNFKTNKPGIFLEGGMHAREWISPATVTYIVNELLTSQDPQIKALFEKYNWYAVPHANPDGFVYSQTTDRLWRKTRSPQANNCSGVDANRNWDIHFGEEDVSSDPCDEVFPGLKAFSEIETKSLSEYLISLKGKINLYLAFHSYGQIVALPWGSTEKLPHNDNDLKQVMNVTIDAIGKRYGTKYTGGNIYTAIYPSSGCSMEWAYVNFGEKMSLEFELRPDLDSPFEFILPADQIIPTGQETLDAIVEMVKEVDKLGYF